MQPSDAAKLNNLQILWVFLKPYKGRVIRAALLTTVSTAISLAPPLLLKFMVDDVIGGGRMDLFPLVLTLLILMPLAAAGIGFVNTYTIALIGQKLVFDLRRTLYRHLQNLPISFYDRSSTGALMERMMRDVRQVNSMVSKQTITIGTDVVGSVIALIVMLSLNWRLTCLAMIVIPIYVVNFRHFKNRIRTWRTALREKMEEISVSLHERLTGAAAVKAFGQEQAESQRFADQAAEAQNRGIKAYVYSVGLSTSSSLIYWLAQTSVYLSGCYLVIRSEMSLGAAIAFAGYCVYLLGPAVRFSGIANEVEQAMVSVRRVFELLGEPCEPEDPPNAVRHRQLMGHVTFEHVNFEYDEGVPVLHDVNLDVPAGKTVALVGHTGCGKTTTVSLLMRFYRPTSGRVLIDGVDINDISRLVLRSSMAMVPQDPVLFKGTVSENIAYGQPDATHEQIVRAAKVAEIHKTIKRLPQGYDTPIGQEGVKLAVGEKQRLVIARAIVTDPAILILDEATSALDTESERLLQRAMVNVMSERTSFVIAHRLSTIVGADIIVVLSEGRIVEIGNHQELLARRFGYYRQLYFTQFVKVA